MCAWILFSEIKYSKLKLNHLNDTPSTKADGAVPSTKAVGGGISVVCLIRTSRYRSKRRSWLVPLLSTAWDFIKTISTQLLIKNGRISSGKRTKHIKAKFFFIKDRVDKGEIKVMDCPTKVMWADVLTKPLQGMVFQTMRAEIMNCPVNYEDPAEDTEEQERKATKYGLKGRSRSTSPDR